MQRFQVGIEDSEDDDGAVGLDSKVDGVREGVDGLDADIVVADGRSGGQTADLLKIHIEGIGKLEPQAVGAAVVILESGIDVVDGVL